MKDKIFRAGAGKSTLEFPIDFFPQEGFTKIHDDLHARVLVIDSNIRVVLVSLELTSLPEPEIRMLKSLVAQLGDAREENIWIMVTHSFSSPHFLPEATLDQQGLRKMDMLRQTVHESVMIALREGLESIQDAKIGIAKGLCDVNVNRDVDTPVGTWIGRNPEGYSDKTLTVLRIDRKESLSKDEPIAILFHYGVQSSVMEGVFVRDGELEITSDLAGYVSEYVEDVYNHKMIAVFLLGAAGDQAPQKKAKNTLVQEDGTMTTQINPEEGYGFIEALGMRFAEEVIGLSHKVKDEKVDNIQKEQIQIALQGQKIPARIQDIRPDPDYEFLPDDKRLTTLEAICMGNIALLGIRPEVNAITSANIKENTAFQHVLITTLVNGGAKYMADANSYERRTYEAMNSFFAKGSAEKLAEEAVEFLNTMNTEGK